MYLKQTFFAFFLMAFVFSAKAEAPQSFNYQAVAREANGDIIANRAITTKFTLLRGPLPGTSLYSEKHSITTNRYGLFSLAVGAGQALSGNFRTINWGLGDIYLKVELDPNGGATYVNMGTTQILSVPFALHAQTVEKNDDADADPANEIQQLQLSGTQLTLSDGGGTVSLPSSGGGDNWGTDVVRSNATLSGNGTSTNPLSIAQQGATTGQILKWSASGWMPGDATSAAVSWTDLTNVPADFADTTDDVDDADADPENELQSLILDNTNLTISDKNTVNLSGFSNIWSKAGDDIFFDTGKVGIGISTPGLMANTIFDVAGRVSFRPADSTKYMIFDNIGAKQRIYTDCSVGTAYDLILGTYPKGHVNQLVLKQSNGYVGIGTADPVAKLTVASETPSTYALLQNSLTGNTASDGFALKEDGTDAYIMNYESGFIQFRTNGNRAMTIASNGNVGIGDAVPEATLKVTGTTKFGDHGTQFTEIKELSGKTDPTLNWKALTLPTGYTETNTRVLSIEINYLGNRWSGLGHDNGGGSNQSTSYILNEGLLYLYYPNLSSYMDRNVRILLMKIPTL